MESILAELPEWARSIFYIAVAIGGSILFILRKNQPQQANRSEPSPGGGGLRLDAAFLDSRQIEKTREALDAHADAIRRQTEAIRNHADALRDQTEATADNSKVGERLIAELHELRDEMSRSRR